MSKPTVMQAAQMLVDLQKRIAECRANCGIGLNDLLAEGRALMAEVMSYGYSQDEIKAAATAIKGA